jgi:hypothetical protein
MTKPLTALILVSSLILAGCCTSKTILSANGNVPSGNVGGTIEVDACTPMEKEVADQLGRLSDWYRAHWDACATNTNPVECRGELSKSYQEQQKLLLDVLAAMNGKPKAEQKKLLQQMRLKNPTLLK